MFSVNAAKKQHVIPRLHLQYFTGEDGRVWTYDALSGRRWSRAPEETATEQHFYSFEQADGTLDTRLEENLARIEDRAAPIYKAILDGNVHGLAPQSRMDFAHFVGLMYSRTRSVRRQAATCFGQFIQSALYAQALNPHAFNAFIRTFESRSARTLTEEQRAKVREGMLDPSRFRMTVYKEVGLRAIALADKLAPIFYNMRWWLMGTTGGYYVTSDHPVVLEIGPGARDKGFLTPTAEVTMPLSPRTLLLMTWRQVEYAKEIPEEHVHAANEARAQNSEQYLYAHLNDEKVASLAAEYRSARPSMHLHGLQPRRFAAVSIARRRPRIE